MPTSYSAPRRAWRSLAIRVGVSLLTLVFLIVILPREQFLDALRKVPLIAWATCVLIYLTLHILGVTKWRITINLAGAGLGVVQAARCYYGGLFGNLFLPSILGGDIVRAGMAFGRTRSKTGLVIGSLLDRILDVTSLALTATLGAILLHDRMEILGQKVLLPLCLAALLGMAVMALVWFVLSTRKLSFRTRRRLARLRKAIRPIVRRPQYVMMSLLLGVVLQSSLVGLNAWLGFLCGLDCPLSVWLFVWPLAKMSAALPITQGGVGVREVALTALFRTFDVPVAKAAAAGMVFAAVVVAGALISGLLTFVLNRYPMTRNYPARA